MLEEITKLRVEFLNIISHANKIIWFLSFFFFLTDLELFRDLLYGYLIFLFE